MGERGLGGGVRLRCLEVVQEVVVSILMLSQSYKRRRERGVAILLD